MSRARQVANFDPALLATDEVSLDKVNGGTLGTGTIGGSSVVNTSGVITTTGAFTSIGIDDNSNALAMTIDSNENVGIGTAAPNQKLQIVGDVTIGSGDTGHTELPDGWNDDAASRFLQISTGTGPTDSGIFLRRDTVGSYDTGLDIWADHSNGHAYIDSRYSNFYIRQGTGGTPITAMTINSSALIAMHMTSSDNNYVMNLYPQVGIPGTMSCYIKADSSVFTGYHYYAKKEPTILYTEGDTIPEGKEIGDVKTQGETFEMGDVVVLENGKATKCTTASATNVAGIISGHPMPGGRWLSNDKDDIATEESSVELACVGDSQDWNKTVDHYLTGFKVCNENGAISSGDLLCSAAKTGYLMKQTGTSITSKTVGKSMDDVTFDSDGNASGVYGFIYSG
jgi:hypothetical protein